MARLIDGDLLLEQMKRRKDFIGRPSDPVCLVEDAPTVEAEPVHNERLYNVHEVACILADVLADPCACDFSCADEWLWEYCEFSETACPNPVGVACWEQYLMNLDKKPKEAEDDI